MKKTTFNEVEEQKKPQSLSPTLPHSLPQQPTLMFNLIDLYEP